MKERQILFSGEMVRVILDGRKTQTRRVVSPKAVTAAGIRGIMGGTGPAFGPCPYGQPADRLWVRESWNVTHRVFLAPDEKIGKSVDEVVRDNRGFMPPCAEGVVYAADGVTFHPHHGKALWRPSIHMPRWASRITLEITGVRVERVTQISEDDIVAEGTQVPVDAKTRRPLLRISGAYLPDRYINRPPAEWTGADWLRAHFASYWDSLNAKRGYGWNANPWVWVIEFKRVDVKPVEAAA